MNIVSILVICNILCISLFANNSTTLENKSIEPLSPQLYLQPIDDIEKDEKDDSEELPHSHDEDDDTQTYDFDEDMNIIEEDEEDNDNNDNDEDEEN